MERDSFLFYRSFYQAIQGLPKDIQLEIYAAVMEYGLNGVVPDDLKPVAKGMFALMKPILDANNARFANGKKGGRKIQPKKASPDLAPEYILSFEQEVELMKTDAEWTASICKDYGIAPGEYHDRLARFLKVCKDSRKGKPHSSFDDAKSHLRYWMDKVCRQSAQIQAEPENSSNHLPPSEYTFNGGFGGMDV